MALQTANPPTTPSAQVVGNAFVEQYYHILHHLPELVHRIYQDSSVLSRPDINGQMISVTTMQNPKVNHVENVPRASSPMPAAEPAHVPKPPSPDPSTSNVDKHQNAAEKAYEPSDCQILLGNEKVTIEESQSQSNGNEVPVGPDKVHVPTNPAKVAPKKIENQPIASASTPPTETAAPSSIDVPENDNNHEEAEGYSIYIRNLPFNVTPTQLEQEFKRFGPIKQGGIQVTNNRVGLKCTTWLDIFSPLAFIY
ncbi:hypothetical protein SLEP1_g20429 [Rubroshorea leprosula]|uniref:NTF2 domain-containing protein n=1 Tax=Rubroshorea leprosula TaxID=152421 RepID=A0AAV5JBV6_9ROSI|nr:hypothetical protein SLEP1_g20429 [Rubroshorea leprosula]